MRTSTPFQMVQSVNALDQNYLRGMAEQVFMSQTFMFTENMNDVHSIPVGVFGPQLIHDFNYTLRQYFPATPYKHVRIRLGRRFPLHRMDCKENCLLLTVVLNTSILGHTLYALDPLRANCAGENDADAITLGIGDAFIHDHSMWMNILAESLDNDYVVMLQAEATYSSPEEREKLLQDALEARQKVLSQVH